MQVYSDPERENAEHALPDVEVFYLDECDSRSMFATEDNINDRDGWYYWPCFPGCMPESEPIGPFATEAEAINDAQEN